ncbi:hypothetical protein OROGR_023629 [Orobanche gracilis]
MVSHFQEQPRKSFPQNSFFDPLYCDEERFGDDMGLDDPAIDDLDVIYKNPLGFLFEHDRFWEDEEISALLLKEKAQQTHSGYDDLINSDGFSKMTRNDAVKWMLNVIGHYGFTAVTTVLAVSYYDRIITSISFQRDKPWMSQLAAVACLSIAAKVEETHVPLLLDFQVEESKYMFESKTIQRMELLVLSTLQWKMNLVTPINFFDHIARRFNLIADLDCEFMNKCESIVLSIITDCRFVRYLPSVVAAAVMKYVVEVIESCDALEYQNQLMGALRTSKEKIDGCYKLILEVIDDHGLKLNHKRKHDDSMPSSPSGVIDAYFSSDSSNDSWAVGPSTSSSPEPLSKRNRAPDQHTRLAWINRLS